VYSTTTSAADGSFSLSLTGVPASQPVCLVETLPNGYNAVSVDVGTTSGSFNATTTTLNFTTGGSVGAYSGIVLGNAPMSTLTNDGSQQTTAGQLVTYAHTYVAGSAGTVTFSTVDNPAPAGQVWTSALYLDVDCSGTLNGVDTLLTNAVSVIAGQQVCILNRVVTPAGAAADARDLTTVKATELWLVPTLTLGSETHVLKNVDTTTVGIGGLIPICFQ
jgi:hypothetical protein